MIILKSTEQSKPCTDLNNFCNSPLGAVSWFSVLFGVLVLPLSLILTDQFYTSLLGPVLAFCGISLALAGLAVNFKYASMKYNIYLLVCTSLLFIFFFNNAWQIINTLPIYLMTT